MDNKKICTEYEERWIDYIVDQVYERYNQRKIVLWGKYYISEAIKERLEKRGIEVGFYVESDAAKIDNIRVFSSQCLKGRSSEYYIVIPLAFYQSLKDELTKSGYGKDLDYYYFSDCILQDTADYYEDSHGNKIVGEHRNLKVAFSGFNSVIHIGQDAGGVMRNGIFQVDDQASLKIGKNVDIRDRYQWFIKDYTKCVIGENCLFSHDICIRTNDGHSIFDLKSGKSINSTYEICKNRRVVIGNHVWIGMRATILYHTVIGDGSVIGAASLVKGEIPNNCIAAGAPAKVIRTDIAWSHEVMADQCSIVK